LYLLTTLRLIICESDSVVIPQHFESKAGVYRFNAHRTGLSDMAVESGATLQSGYGDCKQA
jgi:hypothetical protein